MNKLLLVALFLISLPLLAQKTDDVVYLKNGSIIRGKILEYDIEKQVKIQTSTGNIWVFRNTEIDRVTKEAPYREQYSNERAIGGIYVEPNLSMNANAEWYPGISLVLSGGKRINEKYAVGGGFGIEFFEESMAPLFLQAKYYLKPSAFSPYLETKLGYSFAARHDNDWGTYTGGLLFALEGATNTRITKTTAFQFKLGYRLQNYTEEYYNRNWNDYYEKNVYWFNRFSIGVGFVFF